jgi:MFS transporter, DHA1 family, multidrug resistance protein
MFKPVMPARAEFIALIASVMMIVAFAIDSMLPALEAIGGDLGIANENRWSLVITAFTFGFAVAQLFVGTLSDRFGRRPLLLGSLVAFALFSVLAAVAQSFVLLLAARALQGIAAAGAQVVARSVVRDRFEGREMAQVMSFASAIFMAAPIVAPFMGTAVLAVAPWRWIFIVLALIGMATLLWIALRLPETLGATHRRAMTFAGIRESARIVLSDRQSVAYTIANACLTVTIMGFLTSVTLVFSTTLDRPELLPWGFATMAGVMMVASLVNASIVRRFGMRRIGHSALLGLTFFAALHVAVSLVVGDTLVSFVVLQSLMMACFALCAGNFGAMAMENMGDVAGTASSVQGFFSTLVGAVGGTIIGQSFDGTTAPLYIGITIAGLAALAVILRAEGRLFVPRHEKQAALQKGA